MKCIICYAKVNEDGSIRHKSTCAEYKKLKR